MTFDPSTFNPLGKRLLVLLDRGSEMTPGGLYLPPTAIKTEAYGTVLFIGPDITEIHQGDLVLVDENRGTTLGHNKANQPYNVYNEDDIIAVLDPESK